MDLTQKLSVIHTKMVAEQSLLMDLLEVLEIQLFILAID